MSENLERPLLPILDTRRRLVLTLDDLSRLRIAQRVRLSREARADIIARASQGEARICDLAKEFGVSREAIARTLGRRKRYE